MYFSTARLATPNKYLIIILTIRFSRIIFCSNYYLLCVFSFSKKLYFESKITLPYPPPQKKKKTKKNQQNKKQNKRKQTKNPHTRMYTMKLHICLFTPQPTSKKSMNLRHKTSPSFIPSITGNKTPR